MPGAGQAAGWGLELDREKIVEKQRTADGKSKVTVYEAGLRSLRAQAVC